MRLKTNPSRSPFRSSSAIGCSDTRDDLGETILPPLKAAVLPYELGSVGVRDVPSGGKCHQILSSWGFLERLPRIRVIRPGPVAQESDGNLGMLLSFDEASGTLAHGEAPPDVPLSEAVRILRGVVANFYSATPGDESQARAVLVTPASVLSGLLGGCAPVDLTEADASQAVKGCRNKLTADVYGATAGMVTMKVGGPVWPPGQSYFSISDRLGRQGWKSDSRLTSSALGWATAKQSRGNTICK